jgi:hypothetical protein
MARNDPDWQAEMAELARKREQAANETARVTLVDRGRQGHHIEVDLVRKGHRPAAMQTASNLAELLEAPLHVDRQHAGRDPGDSGVGKQGQPMQHRFYKDDRG